MSTATTDSGRKGRTSTAETGSCAVESAATRDPYGGRCAFRLSRRGPGRPHGKHCLPTDGNQADELQSRGVAAALGETIEVFIPGKYIRSQACAAKAGILWQAECLFR